MKQLKIGVLVSGGGTNLQALIDNAKNGRLHADIAFVASDNPQSYALTRAQENGIPAVVTDYSAIIKAWDAAPAPPPPNFHLEEVIAKEAILPNADPAMSARFFTTRALAEDDLIRKIQVYDFDLLVLAGFMRTLTPYFIDQIGRLKGPFRIMNIHPALLPAFPGRDGYADTFNYGCKVGGCTVHFIDYGEDSGPIIAQATFAMEPGDTLEIVKAKGLKLEWETYTRAINLYATDKVRVIKNEQGRYVTQISV